MTDTYFVDKDLSTPIVAAWLNDVNDMVYKGKGLTGIPVYLNGVTGDGIADDTTAIQALIDASPLATLDFGDNTRTYKCTSALKLVGTGGRNFQGNLIGCGATVDFTHAGNATDADSAMAHGFEVYPTSVTLGSDINGWKGGEVYGLNIIAPAHGAGFYLANSQRVSFEHCVITGGRYSIAMECCINTVFQRNTFTNYVNAGLGLLMSGDTTRVYYGSYGGVANANPSASHWNDSPQIFGNGFQTSSTSYCLAHILDAGSAAESIRNVQGNYFYSAYASPLSGTQYGILTRGGNYTCISNWFENIPYPVRVLAPNSSEGGSTTHLLGVAGAEPSGYYEIGTLVDGYSLSGSFVGNFTARAAVDFDLSGIVGGSCYFANNIMEMSTGYCLQSSQAGSQRIVDGGNTVVASGGGAYKNIPYVTSYVQVDYPSTRVLLGTTTNDNAYAGMIGEYVESVVGPGSATSLTTNTYKNVTTISLTAGDWDVSGNVAFVPTGTTNIANLSGSASVVSGAESTDFGVVSINPNGVTGAINSILPITNMRVTLAVTTTVYLVVKATFTVSTLSAYGAIHARRVR